MKLVLLLVLLSVGNNSTFAHTTKIDSLHTALSKVTSDSERLTLMLNLIEELINVDLEQALQYTSQALNLSRQLGDRAQEALALRYTGLTLYDTDNERPSSLFYFEESERIAEALNLGKLQVHNLMSIANFHRYVSRDSVKVLDNFIKSAEISKEINFHWGTGRSYAKLASFYTKYNQIDLCEHYLELAAKHYVKHPDGLKTIAHYYNEVGDKLWDVNPIKSMELYFKSKEYKVIPNTMVSLAKAHSYIGDNEIAINYLEEAIPHFEKTEKRRRMLGVAIAQLAEVYVKKGEYEAAKQACDEGIELLIRSGKTDQRAMPVFYRLKGIIMEHEGNDEAALEYYIKSQKEAKRVKFAFARIKANLAIGNFYST
ncbi:MAG: hypothetical protein AB8G22_00860, partial [Saprospiraceae bacterium]